MNAYTDFSPLDVCYFHCILHGIFYLFLTRFRPRNIEAWMTIQFDWVMSQCACVCPTVCVRDQFTSHTTYKICSRFILIGNFHLFSRKFCVCTQLTSNYIWLRLSRRFKNFFTFLLLSIAAIALCVCSWDRDREWRRGSCMWWIESRVEKNHNVTIDIIHIYSNNISMCDQTSWFTIMQTQT